MVNDQLLNLLVIDEAACKHDALCVRECPANIIRLEGEARLPAIKPGADRSCLRCGHCVAVCPHGALSHVDIPVEACPRIDKKLVIGKEQAVQFLRSRRSARVFQDKAVEREKIQQLIELARYAPTGSNSQLVEWIVYTDRAQLDAFSKLVVAWMRDMAGKNPKGVPPYIPMLISAWEKGYDVVLRQAPSVVLAMAPDVDRNGLVHCTLALSYLDLAAPKWGLATCWAGLLQGALMASPVLKERMGIPEKFSFHYPMMIGYNSATYYRLPERKPPKINWK